MKASAAFAFAFASLVAARSAQATAYTWVPTGGGLFNTASNWSPAGPPGSSSDSALFDLPNTYTVIFTSTLTNSFFGVDNGNVTFNLSGQTYFLTNTVSFIHGFSGQTARLTLTNGTVSGDLSVGNSIGSIGFLTVGADGHWNAGASIIDVGSVGTGSLTVSGGGTYLGASTLNVGSNVSGNGTVTVTGAGSSLDCVSLSVASTGVGDFIATAGASVSVASSVLLGNTSGHATLTVSGAGSFSCGTTTMGAGNSSLTVTGAGSTFSTNFSTFTIGTSGNATLTIDAGGTVISGTSRIAQNAGGVAQVTVSGAGSTWNPASVAIGGSLGSNGGSGTLVINSGATVNVDSTTEIRGSAGSALTINGGTLTTTGFTRLGSLSILDGTLWVKGLFNNGNSFSPIILDSAAPSGVATLRLSGIPGVLSVSDILVGVDNNGALRIDSGRSVNLADDIIAVATKPNSTGSITVTGFNSALTTTSTLAVGGFSDSSGGAGTFTLDNDATLVVNTLKIWNTPGTVFNFQGGTLNVTTLDTSGNPSRFHWTGGALGIASTSSFSIGNGTPLGATLALNSQQQLLTGGDFDNVGTITIAGALISNQGAFSNRGSFTGYGTISTGLSPSNAGFLTVSGGMLTFVSPAGTFNNIGIVNLAPGATLQLNTPGGASNSGSLNLNSGLINGVTLFNSVSGTIAGPGSILSPFINSGLVIVQGTENTSIQEPWSNSGYIKLTAPTASLNGGNITNDGTIEGVGNLGSTVSNNAVIEAIGGTLRLASVFNNGTGILRASTGGKILATAGLASNTGTISLTGGTFDNNNLPMTNTGTISGFGTFATGGAGLTNNGNITFSGGLAVINGNVTNTATHTLNIAFTPALFTGNLTNNLNATIKTYNTTFTVAGIYTNNGNFIPDPTTSIFQNSVINDGSFIGGPEDTFIFSGGTLNNSGTLTAAGPFNSYVNATNSGSFTLSGAQNWAPNTTFTNTAGAANFLSNAGSAAAPTLSITLSGGTFHATTPQNLKAFTMNGGTFIFDLFTPTTAPTISTADTNGLTLSGGTLQVNSVTTGVASLGYHKIFQYVGTIQGPGVSSIILPAPANDIMYYLYADHAPGFLELHKGFLGDANDDGTVNFADFVQLSNHYGQSSTFWSGGDFNNDDTTNFADFVILSNHYGQSVAGNAFTATADELGAMQAWAISGTPVPEPASLALLVGGALSRLRRRRRGVSVAPGLKSRVGNWPLAQN